MNEERPLSYDSVLTNLNNTIQTNKRQVGQVRWFHPKKGYGMIRNLESKKDIFAHQTELKTDNNIYRQLYPGEYVEYVEGSLSEKVSESDTRTKKIATIITGIGGNMLMCEFLAYTNASSASHPQTHGSQSIQEEIPVLYPQSMQPSLQHQYKHMIPSDVTRTHYNASHVNGVNEDLMGAPLNSFNTHIETVPDKLYNNYQQRKTQPAPHYVTASNAIPLIQYPYPQSVVPMYLSAAAPRQSATPYHKRNEYRPVKK